MQKRFFMVRDLVAAALVGPVMVERHEAPAIRAFSDACSDPKTGLGQHPADYCLMCLGEFDDESGVIVASSDYPRVVVTGAELVKSEAARA